MQKYKCMNVECDVERDMLISLAEMEQSASEEYNIVQFAIDCIF